MLVKKRQYNQLTKKSLMEVSRIIKNLLQSGDVTQEKDYCEMLSKLELEKPAIPEELFDRIMAFIKQNIEPLVYDYDNVFAELHSPDNGYFDEDLVFHIHSDKCFATMLVQYYGIILGVEKKWNEFCSEKLAPIIRA